MALSCRCMNAMSKSILPILRKAGEAIMDVYKDESKFETEYKNDKSPLTIADTRSNDILCEMLGALYPDIPIISEESIEAPYAERATYYRYFLIDPLDGTREFIKRNGEFTINVAYMEGRLPVTGYLYVPVSREIFIGEKGAGAWKMSADGTITPLRSATFNLSDNGVVVVASRSHRDKKTDKMISMLDEPIITSVGSALKFMMIAEGKAMFYPRLSPTMEWDTAAAQCIVEESGGSVIRFDTRLPVMYNKEDLHSPHFLAMGALRDPETLYHILDTL
jgi:3'(2'), 5'-bisphosphate nucleotidase